MSARPDSSQRIAHAVGQALGLHKKHKSKTRKEPLQWMSLH